MERLMKFGLIFLSVALALAGQTKFAVKRASEYPTKLSIEGVTIAAVAYNDPEMCREAFGPKQNPLQYNVLPVLVVIENQTKKAISMNEARVEMVRQEYRVDPVPVSDLVYARGVRQAPGPNTSPLPRIPWPMGKKNPFADPVYEVRSFSAKMIAPGEKASGFLYFLTPWRPGYTLLLRGLSEAATGKELFYYEIPLD